MKRNILFIFCILIIFAINGSFLSAEDAPDTLQVPEGIMTIKAPEPFQTSKTPVRFSHSTHLKFSCIACHHDWDRSSPVQGCSASGCHEKLMPSPPSGKPSQNKKVISLTGAYHKTCRGCHRDELKLAMETAKTNPEQNSDPHVTGPIACDGCHPENFVAKKYPLTSFSLPLGMITIDPPDDVEAKRSSVNFPHSLHFDQDCQVCHHDWESGKDVQNCTTSGCHDQSEPDGSTRDINDPRNNRYFLTAYHKACYHCHMDLKKQKDLLAKSPKIDGHTPSDQNAPTNCSGCHNEE